MKGGSCVKGTLSLPELPPLEWGVAELGEGSHLNKTLHRLELCMAGQCVHMPRYSQNRSLEDLGFQSVESWMRAKTPSLKRHRHSPVQDQTLFFSSLVCPHPLARNTLISILIVHSGRISHLSLLVTDRLSPYPRISDRRAY